MAHRGCRCPRTAAPLSCHRHRTAPLRAATLQSPRVACGAACAVQSAGGQRRPPEDQPTLPDPCLTALVPRQARHGLRNQPPLRSRGWRQPRRRLTGRGCGGTWDVTSLVNELGNASGRVRQVGRPALVPSLQWGRCRMLRRSGVPLPAAPTNLLGVVDRAVGRVCAASIRAWVAREASGRLSGG